MKPRLKQQQKLLNKLAKLKMTLNSVGIAQEDVQNREIF